MSELELYKFIENCEYHWDYKDKNSKEKDEVFLLINFNDLKEFNEMLGVNMLDEGGIECRFLRDCVGFEMSDICESLDIDMKKVFDNYR